MFNYLAFIYGGIEKGRTGTPNAAVEDGIDLARQCIEKLRALNSNNLPPKLLILLASPAYLQERRTHQLVEGIHIAFRDAEEPYHEIPLIGSSVAGVFFKGEVHQKGALLVCLASRLLEVKIACSSAEGVMPDNVVKELLHKLELDSERGEDLNPFANHALFTFLPGLTRQGYMAPGLHKSLRERVWARVPIIGGVSSGYNGEHYLPAVQFANRQVLKNSIVAARLTSGTLLGMSVNDGLERTKQILKIAKIAEDRHTVKQFDQGGSLTEVREQLHKKHGFFVLGRSSFNGEPFIEQPWSSKNPALARLLMEASEGDAFTVMQVTPGNLAKSVSDSIERSCKSIALNNAIGCLGFRCSSYIANCSEIGLDLHDEIDQVEKKLLIKDSYVGGFVDGETGKDKEGRSVLRSWSTAAIVFGDELRPRTAVYQGFDKIADFLSDPSMTELSEHSVHLLLKLIYDVGFPGARLMLVLDDNEGKTLVVPDTSYTIGSLALMDVSTESYRIKLNGDEGAHDLPAAIAARLGKSRFTPYVEAGDATTSYYYMPLKTLRRRQAAAVLQVDMGKKKKLPRVEEQLLRQLGIVVGASLTRIIVSQESSIRSKLLETLKKNLPATETNTGLKNYLTDAVKALGLKMGHIRQVTDRYSLELCAGVGEYYEAALDIRRNIDFGDMSPTTKAYGQKETIIINDAFNDPDHLRMIESQRNAASEAELRFKRALEQVGSYANIYFESESGTKGIISFVSNKPWFFKHSEKRVLHIIKDHIEFLINHLELQRAKQEAVDLAKKEQENAEQAQVEAELAQEEAELARSREEQTNKRLAFLLDVGPHLAQQNLNDFQGTLKNILLRFCRETQAEVGSLYLWEQARNLYVLRAEHGWRRDGWVNAAAYNKDAGWFGARALKGEPRYIPDLHEYYRTEGYYRREADDSKPGGLYAEFMFGQNLSDEFSVEVIGLPLKIGQGIEIGVIALYRRVRKGRPSGFLKTVVETIQIPEHRGLVTEAALDVAGLIGALLQHHDDKTEKEEQERRKRIADTLYSHIEQEPGGSVDQFDELICRRVADLYGAVRADLYILESPSAKHAAEPMLKASIQRRTRTPHQAPAAPDRHFQAALNMYTTRVSGAIGADDIYVKRKALESHEHNDPRKAVMEGMVERVIMPLVLGKELFGVLDLHWDITSRPIFDAEAHLHKKYFWQLSEDLSKFSRLYKQTRKRTEAEKKKAEAEKIARQREKARRELHSIVAIIAESAHTYKGLKNKLKKALKRFEPIVKDQQFYTEISQAIDETDRRIPRILRIAGKEKFELKLMLLRPVIKRAWDEILGGNKSEQLGVRLELEMPELSAIMDRDFIAIAFENVIINALASIDRARSKGRNAGTLTIRAEPQRQGRVKINFIDDGDSISQDICDDFNAKEYSRKKEHWGLFIIAGVIDCHNGELKIFRREGEESGTIVSIVLPCSEEYSDETENLNG